MVMTSVQQRKMNSLQPLEFFFHNVDWFECVWKMSACKSAPTRRKYGAIALYSRRRRKQVIDHERCSSLATATAHVDQWQQMKASQYYVFGGFIKCNPLRTISFIVYRSKSRLLFYFVDEGWDVFYMGGGGNLEKQNVEWPIFRNLKIADVKSYGSSRYSIFIYELIFWFFKKFIEHSNFRFFLGFNTKIIW